MKINNNNNNKKKKQGLEKEASSGWGPPTGHFLNTTRGSTVSHSSEKLEDFYTVDLLDQVAKAYRADLQAFNYTTFYHSLRSRLSRRLSCQTTTTT